MKERKKSLLHKWLDCVWYVCVFMLIQYAAAILCQYAWPDFLNNSFALGVSTAASSVVTVILFTCAHWFQPAWTYLHSRPWNAMLWVGLMAIATIVPSLWLNDLAGVEMPKTQEEVLLRLMRSPLGFCVVGLLVPIAEEVVFRGALLRKLLVICGEEKRWAAIALSALVFGCVHGNWAQMLHATLLGLLLGWMFCCTHSILPGVVLHLANNAVAYLLYALMPGTEDMSLQELCGSEWKMYLCLAVSVCIFLPSLHQTMRKL